MAAVIDAHQSDVIDRILTDYRELPLRLTVAQAARLWQLDAPDAAALLELLVAAGYLCREGGCYIRGIGLGRAAASR